MKDDAPISEELAETLIKICFDVEQYKRLYEITHPKSAKTLFSSIEKVAQDSNLLFDSISMGDSNDWLKMYLSNVRNTQMIFKQLTIEIHRKNELLQKLDQLEVDLIKLKIILTKNNF